MKNFFLIAGGILIGAFIILIFRHDAPLSTPPPPLKRNTHRDAMPYLDKSSPIHGHSHDHSHSHTVLSYPESEKHRSRDSDLEPRVEKPVDLATLGIDISALKEATSDPALMRILALYKPPAVGAIKEGENGEVILELPGSRSFVATYIGAVRSESQDGTVALEAITVPNGYMIKEVDAHDGGVSTAGNPSEIWIVNADGTSSRVSPQDVHAKNPIISPDGRFIAFSAQYVTGNALHGKFLMIADKTTMQINSYATKRSDSTYEIRPVDWVDDGKVLRVVEDWGETGGHMLLKQVRAAY